MKAFFNSIFLAVSFLITPALQNAQAAPNSAKEMTPEIMINQFVKDLSGIELYFMLETIDDQTTSLKKMAELMHYWTGKVPESITMMLPTPKDDAPPFAGMYPFNITKINRKAGYMRMERKGAEGSITMTYWNIDKSRKLIGTLQSLCTMVCEVNNLSFTLFADGKFEPYSTIDIPKEVFDPAYYLRDKNNTEVLANDAWGIEVLLPEKGTDITIRLENMDSRNEFAKNTFSGNCVKLAWQKTSISFKLQPISWCD